MGRCKCLVDIIVCIPDTKVASKSSMHLIAIHYIFKSYKVELKGDKTKNQRNFKANANKNIKIHDK